MDTGIRPEVIREIKELAKKHNLNKVILFGSRARGDYRRTSDIDLAISGGNTAAFTIDIEETSTLLAYDVVDLDKPVEEQLLESIRREGKEIYEKI